MRPNLAQDPPPTAIDVGGCSYPANTDYRVWLDVMAQLRELIPDADTPEDRQHNADAIIQAQLLVFGGVLKDESPGDVLKAVSEFARGYPGPPYERGGDEHTDGPPILSLDYDLNEIIIAIRNQSGIDLSYRRTEPFHWWEFLLELKTLAGESYIGKIMEIRSYKGKDKEMRKLKARYTLPAVQSAADRKALEEIDALFYNA